MLETLYPIISQGILITALVSSIRWLKPFVIGIWVLILCVLLLPIEDLPSWYYLRAVIGDLSLSTTLICAWFLWNSYQGRFQNRDKALQQEKIALDWLSLCGIFTLLGILLYPLALGWSSYDTYGLGYYHWFLTALVSLLAIFFYVRQKSFFAFLFASILIGYALNLLESTNLWDYLIDPLLFLYCVFHLLKVLMLKLLSPLKRRTNR